MAEVFNVGGSIPRLDEYGGGANHTMLDVHSRLSYDALSGGRGSNCWYDPLTRCITPRWDYVAVDDLIDNYTFAGASSTEFAEVRFPRLESNKTVLYYKTEPPATWAAVRKKRTKAGEGIFFFFHALSTYIELAFGGGWNLVMVDQAPVMLKWAGKTVEFGPNFEFSHRDQYFAIYSVGPNLIIKWSPDFLGGMVVSMQNITTPFADGEGNLTALGTGQVAIQCNGTAWFSIRDMRFENEYGFELSEHIPLWNQSSQVATGIAYGYGPSDVTVTGTILDQNDSTMTAGGTAWRWQIDVSNDSDPLERWKSAFIYRIDINIPRVLSSSTTSPVDLNSIGAVENVVWTRSINASDNSLRFTVYNTSDLSSYLTEGQAIDWVSGGTVLFTGLITRIERSDLGSGAEQLTIEANAAQILYTGTAVNITDQAGSTVETALIETFNAAGIPSADLDVTSTGLDFVIPANGEAPVAPRAGDSPGHFIDHLLQSYAPDHMLLPQPDWNFDVLDLDDTITASVTFGADEIDANRVFIDTVQSINSDQYYNGVICVGQDDWGNLLISIAIDWTAVNNAQPYRLRALVIIDSGLRTQEMVNWVCLKTFEVKSQKLTTLRWRGTWVAGIIPSQRAVVGSLGTYRITRIEVQAQGPSTATWICWYEGVKVA